MKMTTKYLGLDLKNPIVCGASPLGNEIDTIRRLEDAGTAAIVLHSLFEEDILKEIEGVMSHEEHTESFAEAKTYLPDLEGYHLGPEPYLEFIQKTKEAVGIPIIASLNGATPGGWTNYAKKMEEAGADAIELNLYL
jgi:dihydroorotate dehydrogenase (fumarate)